MNRSIDFAKSIRRKRLIYQGTRKQRLFLSVRHFMSGAITLLICLALIAFAYYGGAALLIVVLVSVPALLVIISMFLQNRLATAKSTRTEEDQTAIIRFLLRKYPGIIRHNCGEQIIIITSPRTSTFNKEYLILQDGEHIYMNISLYGRGNLKFVFLSIPQYLTSKAVLKNFRQTILRSARATQQKTSAVV
ncbi:hypothetical protein Q4E93_07700 [Flavitalea sp. BT771]|uniref:hypothetical protein n=1 Tax=Flavitalea sp. BT771 TaxID=3063329 RepID=UPI0026E3B610|nr:hypothetical protein [Flavitalea sp. BT771]MDO6430465.1 hypothetical protein [Flavitalea sp. BT771]MDV6219395.1 hypothetical protein [Flavitalea sp. BT771]